VPSNLRWKLITILSAFVIFAAVGVYPILAERYHLPAAGWLMEKQLKLGLDLKGGVHLVLRVQTDDALRGETQTQMERLREELQNRRIPVTNLTLVSPTQFRVEGVPTDQEPALRQAAQDVQATFDRGSAVNGSYTFTMKPNIQVNLRGDEILVQLPGVSDVDRAKNIIQSTGRLDLKIVEQGPAPTREALLVNGQVPSGMEIVPGPSGAPGDAGTVYYLLRSAAAVTGRDLRTAQPTLDENNQPAVRFTLSTDGAKRFGKITGENIGRQLAIVLDERVQSAPRLEARITTDGRITGGFTQQEAQDLALILRSGSLSAGLTYLQERTIGPTLGADSIRSGVFASIIGLLLIVLFMLVYYKLSGVNAVVALIFNLIILLGLMAYIGAVMTLPGIAGFVLTMGIGVDSNVLIFERIKEELEAQRGVRASINAGFERVFTTLVDTHVASLISCAFLFQFGTGPIRGFAVTLFFGLISNLFTSIFVSKTLFELVLGARPQPQAASLSI